MSLNKKTILVLADVNPRATIATLRALKNAEISIYLCFSKRSITSDIIYHKYYENEPLYYDRSSEDAFIESLISIRNTIGSYILLPYGEALLRWAIKQKEEFKKLDIILPTVDHEKYTLVSDKGSFADLCRDSGIDIPQEIVIDWTAFERKFVIKPKKLINGQRCLKYPVLVENSESFQKLKETDIDVTKHLIQDYIDGPSIYYCAYWEDGACKLSFVQKNIVQQPAGKSVVKAVPYNLPTDVFDRIEGMLQQIDWEGVIMIEVKEDLERHRYYAIEANPRFWGPLQIAVDNGINFPAALIGLDSDEDKPEYPYGYLWSSGYVSGFFTKLQTKTGFQKFDDERSTRVSYRDVWLREDTYLYFFMEPIITIASGALSPILRIFKKFYRVLRVIL